MSPLIEHFDLLAASLGGVAKLRELILNLAVRGMLVPQDPSDEPASVLLQKIRAEKDRLIAEGKIKRDKKSPFAPLLQRGVTTKSCANSEATAQTPPFAKGGAGGIDISDDEKPYDLPAGWEWIYASDTCTVITDGDHQAPPKADTGIPFLVIGDVVSGTVNLASASRFVPDEYFVGLGWQKQPLAGDILYTTVGSYGVPIPVLETQQFCFQRHIALFRPAIVSMQSYLSLVLKSDFVFRQASQCATGIAQKTVPLSGMRQFLIPLPPLAEQSRIVAKVEELMALCDRLEAEQGHAARMQGHWMQAALDQLAESSDANDFRRHWQHLASHFDTLFATPESIAALEATLLQLAVRGKLVAQDPGDQPASELLKQIRAEKDLLILEGKIKRDKLLPPIRDEEKPYELPEGWEWVRLNDAYDVRDGTHDSPKYQATGIPLVTSKNLYSGKLDISDVKLISEEDHRQISLRSKVDKGDVLFAMIGSIGNPAVVDIDTEFSIKNMALFKHYSRALSHTDFLLLSLKTAATQMKQEAAGGVQSFVSLGGLRKFLIPLPPITEQARIVAQLEKLLALTAELKTRLASTQARQAQLAGVLIEDVLTC